MQDYKKGRGKSLPKQGKRQLLRTRLVKGIGLCCALVDENRPLGRHLTILKKEEKIESKQQWIMEESKGT